MHRFSRSASIIAGFSLFAFSAAHSPVARGASQNAALFAPLRVLAGYLGLTAPVSSPKAQFLTASQTPKVHLARAANGVGTNTGTTYTVNSTGDGSDGNVNDGACDISTSTPSGICTLRAAIEQANANSGADTINFDLPAGISFTISPRSALPTITEAVTIDGTTQSGFSTTPVVTIDGTNAGSGIGGLSLNTPACTIKGLCIVNFGGTGITISTASTGNTIQTCYIGVATDGSTRAGNGSGIQLSSTNNLIGGLATTPGKGVGNVISGNGGLGLGDTGDGSANPVGNTIQGNVIGLTANQSAALPNVIGIQISSRDNDTVGAAGNGHNVLAGNSVDGIDVFQNFAAGNDNNVIQGNRIGTNDSNAASLGNGGVGIFMSGVGDTILSNTILSNPLGGIILQNATGILIQQNNIGFIGKGNADGIGLNNGAQNNIIGGAATDTFNAAEAKGNLIAGNTVGVFVSSGSNYATGNTIRGNTIESNTGLGIDLSGGTENSARVTQNDTQDVDTGDNNLQNYPVITNVNGTTIKGTLNSTPSTTFVIDFYDNSTADVSGYGEGSTGLGSKTVTTNASGNVNFTVTASAAPSGAVSATATNQTTGDTSEFSADARAAQTYVVDTTSDANLTACTAAVGDCSLRGAINAANANSGAITFNIPGGVKTISPASALPTITGTTQVDATSQPGYAGTPLIFLDGTNAGANVTGLTASVSVTIQGFAIGNFAQGSAIALTAGTGSDIESCYLGLNASGAQAANRYGVTVSTSNSTIGGTTAATRNIISGNSINGINLTGAGTSNITVTGNYIGTNVAGTAAIRNSSAGIIIQSGAKNNIIGGSAAGAGNLISGNQSGITLDGTSAAVTSNTIRGNLIGTNAAGTTALSNNGTNLVLLTNANNNTIGGAAAGAGNILASANGGAGIGIVASNTNTIQGNFIGTNANGANLGNSNDGIGISTSSANNNIAGNEIAFNTQNGVTIQGSLSTGNSVHSNSIHDNGFLGIDLGNDGVTANDAGDGDTGPNNLQNYPVLTGATLVPGSTTVFGTLNSTPNTQFTLEFFSDPSPDASGFGEGQTLVFSTTSITTDANGNVSFGVGIPGTVTDAISATATPFIAPFNTSEFSNAVRAAQNFVVDTISDANLTACTAAAGDCSLRGAINNANANSGADTISFAIPGAGVHTIVLTSALPTISDPVTLDGYSQTGAKANTLATGDNAVLNIQITGSASVQGAGLNVTAANCTIQGLVLNGFNDLGNGLGDGTIALAGAGATSNTVQGCFIGLDAAGLQVGNAVKNLFGVIIINGANHNTIGGTTAAARNIISGSQITGIGIGVGAADNGLSNNNMVRGNYIGTNKNGTAAIANGTVGTFGASGIFLQRGATNNIIGGTSAATRNIISGNNGDGVGLSDAATSGTKILGNYIGTNVAGTVALPNSGSGVRVSNATSTIIGNSGTAANVISGNSGDGITLTGANTVVKNNDIGLDVNGNSSVGNGGNGISIASNNNTIGGITGDDGNAIYSNGKDGVNVASGTGNAIRGNKIYGNTESGIDLGPNGPATNDAKDLDTGANNLQNTPIITNVSTSGGATTISGKLNSAPGQTFAIDIFRTSNAGNGGFGEGEEYLGTTTVTPDSVSGDATFTFTQNPALGSGDFVTATATATTTSANTTIGDTSEFSKAKAVTSTQSLIVNTTASDDDGSCDALTSTTDCTLTEAINAANANSGPDTISFAIPGSGAQTIAPFPYLPSLLDDGTTIDGTSQPGFTNKPLIVIAPPITTSGAQTVGIDIRGANCVIKSLVLNANFNNVSIYGTGATGNKVQGCYIGLNAAGNAGVPCFKSAEIGGGAKNNLIGGTTAAERNVISGKDIGVWIRESGTEDNVVQGNFIGTNAAGTTKIGGSFGVYLSDGARLNTVRGNVIAGNGEGINIERANANAIQGNFVGTNRAGATGLGNTQSGVLITSGSNNLIGGTTAGDANTIFNNGLDGVTVASDNGNAVRGNAIRGNKIFNNGGLGIDLVSGGETNHVTPNDVGDGDGGANNLQNYPVLTSAINESGGTRVRGSLNSTSNAKFDVEFFDNVTADPSGYGQGQKFVSKVSGFSTGSTGTNTFNVLLPTVAIGHFLSATATSTSGDTSEFAKVVTVKAASSLPTLSVNNIRALEGESGSANAIFTVTLSKAAATDVSVQYATANRTAIAPGDYTSTTGTLTIAAGQTTGTIAVPVIGDTTVEPDETFTINLSAPSGATIADAIGLATITNDDVAPDLIVNSAADTDDGSCDALVTGTPSNCTLREAINKANLDVGPQTIAFAIPGSGIPTITLRTSLPSITQPLTINGFSQNAAIGQPAVEINGNGRDYGLTLQGSSGVIKGLIINLCNKAGVRINGGAAQNNTVRGCFIGTNSTGVSLLPNQDGIEISGGAKNNVIGGAGIAHNLLSGNFGRGVVITGAGTTNNSVLSNLIGTTKDGLKRLPNNIGVEITGGASANSISRTSANDTGLISGNNQAGIAISGNDNVVSGSVIGLNANGVLLSNGAGGIVITNGARTQIGNATAGNTISHNTGGGILVGDGVTSAALTGNTIINNSGDGVTVSGTANGVTIRNNQFVRNTGLGINLAGGTENSRAVTANDLNAKDSDNGPNNLQNYPILTNIAQAGDGDLLLLNGSVDSAASRTFAIDVYASATQDPSKFGEGEIYLGTFNAQTDANGIANFANAMALPPAQTDVRGKFITLTATDTSTGDTSEFSKALQAPATFGTLAVQPTIASVQLCQAQQFTATLSGIPFGAVNWSVTKTGGAAAPLGVSISSSGLFTSSVEGSFTITATSQKTPGATANATITVAAVNAFFGWGFNDYGSVGDGTTGQKNAPVSVNLPIPTIIAAGGSHSLAVAGGKLYAWGLNGDYQLGLGDQNIRATPTQVTSLPGTPTALACGFYHSLAVVNGDVYAWGLNRYGQCGQAPGSGDPHVAVPTKVPNLPSNVVEVSAGVYFSVARTSTGDIYAWGSNLYGQCGPKASGTVQVEPVKVLSGASAIGAGAAHAAALVGQKVMSWGLNETGQLGNGQSGTGKQSATPVQAGTPSGMTLLAVGYAHTLASNGTTVYSWGDNGKNELGRNGTTNDPTPGIISGLTGVTQLAAGSAHNLAVKSGGTLYSWGFNKFGSLGLGDTSNRATPVQVTALTGVTKIAAGYAHSFAVAKEDLCAAPPAPGARVQQATKPSIPASGTAYTSSDCIVLDLVSSDSAPSFYRVTVNGREVEVQGVQKSKGGTTLLLPPGTLKTGAKVVVTWSSLDDAQSLTLQAE